MKKAASAVSYTDAVAFSRSWYSFWSQSRVRWRARASRYYEILRTTGELGSFWDRYGAICCECVLIRALGMFLALCFRINTCWLRTLSPRLARTRPDDFKLSFHADRTFSLNLPRHSLVNVTPTTSEKFFSEILFSVFLLSGDQCATLTFENFPRSTKKKVLFCFEN